MNLHAPFDADDSRFVPNPGRYNANPGNMGFWALVAEDFATHERDFFSQGFWALFWHRFGNWRMSVRPRALRMPLSLIYKIMFKASEVFCGIMLPYTTYVGRRVKLEHFGGMVLVAQRIGDDVTIRQNTTFGLARTHGQPGRPIIGDRVDIGAGAVVIGKVEIGDDTVVGANAVVTRKLPAGCVAVGVPARILKGRDV